MSHPALTTKYPSAFAAFHHLVPEYRNYGRTGLRFSFTWHRSEPAVITSLSPRRTASRISTYIIPEEIVRVRELIAKDRSSGNSIRLGYRKTGHGVSGERGDFCIVGAVTSGQKLTVFYRKLDLLGGFLYDLAVFDNLITTLNLPTRTVEIFAVHSDSHASPGNSNEKLFRQMREY